MTALPFTVTGTPGGYVVETIAGVVGHVTPHEGQWRARYWPGLTADTPLDGGLYGSHEDACAAVERLSTITVRYSYAVGRYFIFRGTKMLAVAELRAEHNRSGYWVDETHSVFATLDELILAAVNR